MPRAETQKASAGSQPYQSPTYDSSPSSSNHNVTTTASSKPSAPAPKKKHVCQTCERAFTTSGHLARHSRVHTGERNHKCPFPGCETRCSRADNLQQHYRIHLSPGSRRSSARSRNAGASSAVPNSNSGSSPAGSNNPIAPTSVGPIARRVPVRAASTVSMSSVSSSVASGSAHEVGSSTGSSIHSTSPPVSPPPLEPAVRALYSTSPSASSNPAPSLSLTGLSHSSNSSHLHPSPYHSHHSASSSQQYHSPPDSPPPLTQATLPATAHPHHQSFDYESAISRGANSASPDDVGYALGGPDLLQQSVGLNNATSSYGYRTITAGPYQDDSFGATSYGASPSSSSPSSSPSYGAPGSAGGDYSSPATTATSSGLSGTSLHQIHTRHNSPASSLASSRHSISHISSAATTLSSYPPSPVSAQSALSHHHHQQHQSGPPTPTYAANAATAMSTYSDDGAYHYSTATGQGMIHGSYPIHAGGRFDSPSPTLAPIQDGTRFTQQVAYARRDSHHQQQQHQQQVMERHQQLYQPQPATSVLGGEFGMGYHPQQYAAPARAWQDVGLRKGLGTLVG